MVGVTCILSDCNQMVIDMNIINMYLGSVSPITWTLFLLSSLLILSGFLIFFRTGVQRVYLLLAECGLFLFSCLTVLYFVSNRFTECGINTAVLYHLRTGLSGAGFADFYDLIGEGLLFLAIMMILAVVAYVKIPNAGAGKGRWAWRKLPLWLILASLLVHPAVLDITRLCLPLSAPSGASFKKWFVTPALSTPESPRVERKPDLIWIYLESVERTYFDQHLFPGLAGNLRHLEQEGVSFVNLDMIEGSEWTIGGMVASQCGMPLITPSWGESMGAMDHFLSGATCIGDLLHDQGYLLSYMGGADLNFSGKGKFYQSHGFTRVQGLRELLPRIKDPLYRTAWGLYDDSLFDLAWKEFLFLEKQKQPFGLFLLTLDTHHPHGHASKTCGGHPYKKQDNPMLDAVHCSDELVADFIRKIRKTSRGKKAVIVVSSDHLAQYNLASRYLRKGKRKELFLVLDGSAGKGQNRKISRHGTVLDEGATVLDFLGYRTPVGLGRDLLDPGQSPLVDQFKDFSGQLASWHDNFIQLWDFPRLDGEIQIRSRPAGILLNGHEYRSPLLMTWDATGQTTFYFNDPFGPKVLDYYLHLDADTPFFWMDQCAVMRPFVGEAAGDGICFVYGKPGLDMRAEPVLDQVIGAEILQRQRARHGNEEIFARQRRKILASRIRPAMKMLVSAIPDNSLIYANDPHQDWDLQLYFQDPEIRGRGLQYTNRVPGKRPFFFVASDLNNERKKLPNYQVSFYFAPKTLRDFLASHLRDTVILAVKDEATTSLSAQTRKYLASLGLAVDRLTYRGSYAAVLKEGKVLAQRYAPRTTVVLESEELKKIGVDKVVSGGALASNRAEIWYRGKNYALNRRGFNVVVIDKRDWVQSACFDTFRHEWEGYAVFRAVPKQ